MAMVDTPADVELDSATLQAQIDVALSAAYGLVTSWMKPAAATPSAPSSSSARELDEHIRRPPRLGLGAAVPKREAALIHDAAKLVRKLGNGKRPREEDSSKNGAPSVNPTDSDDDDESRGRAIAHKAPRRVAPLLVGEPKKKKPRIQPPPSAKERVLTNDDTTVTDDEEGTKGNEDEAKSEDGAEMVGNLNDMKKRRRKKKNKNSVIIAQDTLPAPNPRESPVLNLDGPPIDEGGVATEGDGMKKRKRKKKKKKRLEEQVRS